MNIIYIANSRIPTEKAHGLQIMKSCEAFALAGASVSLVLPTRYNPITEDAFSYYAIKPNFKIKKVLSPDFLRMPLASSALFHLQTIIFSLAAISRFLGKTKNDPKTIFYSRDFISLFFLCLFGYPTVAEIHDYRLARPSRVVRFVLNKSLKIVVNSPGTLDALKSHYRLTLEKFIICPNGVDVNFFDVKESREAARDALKINPTKQIVAYVGRIETAGVDKGVGLLLEAFKLLVTTMPNVLLYVVGGPPELSVAYHNQALLLGLTEARIKFTGPVPYRQIPLYLRAVDVVVIPLPQGKHAVTTSPIKLFEFMAAGKVIVVPNFPSMTQYLDHQSAWFFEPDNAVDLSHTIETALAAPDQGRSQGARAADLARNFTWQKRAEKILNFI